MGLPSLRFHDLRHTFATLTLDIYTHITDDIRLTAAANIDRSIGKAAPQEGTSESCSDCGQKAENDRLQALCRPKA